MTLDQNPLPSNVGYQDVKPSKEIFVVDDDEDVREILAGTLAPEGFPVTTFEDGESFLRAAIARVPICVFLDVVMPKRSGLEILRELRARRYVAPIFLLSGMDDIPTVVEAMKNGAHDYIKKPFDRQTPALYVRNAIEVWSYRVQEKNTSDLPTDDNREWFHLTPSERQMVALARLMEHLK